MVSKSIKIHNFNVFYGAICFSSVANLFLIHVAPTGTDSVFGNSKSPSMELGTSFLLLFFSPIISSSNTCETSLANGECCAAQDHGATHAHAEHLEQALTRCTAVSLVMFA